MMSDLYRYCLPYQILGFESNKYFTVSAEADPSRQIKEKLLTLNEKEWKINHKEYIKQPKSQFKLNDNLSNFEDFGH